MATEERTSSYGQGGNPGPFLAQVVSHLDQKYMGELEVELLSLTGSGNNTATTGQVKQVRYLSPFYGVTPYKDTTNNAGYQYTQKSYGMWAVPPDVGSIVLVIFIEGNQSQGFWIGCVPDEYMNFMIPGYGATTYNSTDNSKLLPVGEYNKRQETARGRNPTQFIKPTNQDAVANLTKSGLLTDPIRGVTSSSARREIPSMVFGWSSPGPADRRPGAPTGKYGKEGQQINAPVNRLGGSSFVMDDGDISMLRKGKASETPSMYAMVESGDTSGDPTLPHNDLVRIRTRTGHQILLHNTEDLIYISHGSGNSWIEMTANGKIDIYSSDSVNVHAGSDINFTAGRNFNVKAGGDINLKAGGDGRIQAANTHIKASTHTESAPGGINMNGPEAAPANEPNRIPQHEPWGGHESFNPAAHTPEKTDNNPEKQNTRVDTGPTNGTTDSGNESEAARATAAAMDTFRQACSQTPQSSAPTSSTTNDPSGAGDGAAAQNGATASGAQGDGLRGGSSTTTDDEIDQWTVG